MIDGIEIDAKGGLMCLNVYQLIQGVPNTRYKGWADRVGALESELMVLRHQKGVAEARQAVQRRLNAARRLVRELEKILAQDHAAISVAVYRAAAQRVRADAYWLPSDISDEQYEDRTHETWPVTVRRVEPEYANAA